MSVLTREQIEKLRSDLLGWFDDETEDQDRLNALCDQAASACPPPEGVPEWKYQGAAHVTVNNPASAPPASAPGEYGETIRLANRILDTPYIDPDGDICLLARQFLRCVERLSAARAPDKVQRWEDSDDFKRATAEALDEHDRSRKP